MCDVFRLPDPLARGLLAGPLGSDACHTCVAYSRDAFTDLRFDIQEAIGGDGRVAIRWLLSGTHEGDLPGLPVTGRRSLVSGMTFHCFEGGRLCGHAQASDQLGFLSQTGSLEHALKKRSRGRLSREGERHVPRGGSTATDASGGTPAVVYHIRVQGHLGRRWADAFDGLTVTLEKEGVTRLAGPVADQPALHALLRHVRDLGLPLLSVARVEDGPPEDDPCGTVR